MSKLVNLPNGKQGSFPDNMSNEQIEAVLKKQFPTEVPRETSKKGVFNLNIPELESQFVETQTGAAKELPYVAQGAVKEPFKMANVLLPKSMKIPTDFDVARQISPSLSEKDKKEAESLGGMMGMGIPRAGIMGSLKAAQGIPHIGKVLKEAMRASTILNKLVDVGGRGAEFGLYEAAEHPENALTRGSLGFGLGAGLSALGHGIPALYKKADFGKQLGEETIEGLTYNQVAPQVEASERLGTPLRPSEATGNPFIAGLEGRYPRTREAAQENVEMGMERTKLEKKSINKLLRIIYDKSASSNAKINNLYTTAAQHNLDPVVLNQLKQDPLIDNAIQDVSKNPAWQRDLGGIPENNLAYLDRVKRALYDKEKGLKVSAPGEASQYKQARENLVSELDKVSPEYKEARNLAELKKARSTIQKKMREEEVSGSAFYNKIIKNDDEFKKIMNSLRNEPKAQKILTDMKTAWSNLINVEKPNTASYQSEKATNQARGSLKTAIEMYQNLFGKKKNVEAVKFIRSDAWVKKLRQAQQTGKKQDVEQAVNDIMMKILPVSEFLTEENSK